jgi:PII-like signaling protein
VSRRPGEALKLCFYFGEHDRHRGRFLSEAILGICERRRIANSVLLRGIEGFGAGRRLQTDRLLSLSEDLPLVAVGVDAPEPIEALAGEIAEIAGDGLLTLERARIPAAGGGAWREPHEEVKLTLHVGRNRRSGTTPAHVAAVAVLHRHRVAGATTLIGVDGTAGGERRRARLLGANADVPAMVIAVGERAAIGAALTEIDEAIGPTLATLEAVTVCRRDGVRLASPELPPDDGGDGLGLWTKLMVYCSERSTHGARPLYAELVHRLRAEGAGGATALRGAWGYHGDHAPHGDRLLSLRRHVPVVVVAVDRPTRARRWLALAEELTERTGLMTVETIPALRISGPGGHLEGGLRLAGRPD